jgi:uncharacterized protein (DUF4213/DUF364 family)
MKIAVKDRDGNVYTNDMSSDKTIIEIHFGTSYTQAIVQTEVTGENGVTTYPEKNVFIPTEADDLASALDFIAVSDSEIGEWAVV